jgi:uncharacterized membrane protein YdjX (TVP38/TMEM64 family)
MFISILGLIIGAIISFMIVRYLARDYVEKKWIHKIKKLEHFDEHLTKRGFITVLLLRLICFIPYELTNIIAGLSRVSFRSYLLGTIIGIIPGTILTIYFIKTTNNLHSFQFILAITLFTVFAMLPLFSKKVRKFLFE